jgi:hypothetical protein
MLFTGSDHSLAGTGRGAGCSTALNNSVGELGILIALIEKACGVRAIHIDSSRQPDDTPAAYADLSAMWCSLSGFESTTSLSVDIPLSALAPL